MWKILIRLNKNLVYAIPALMMAGMVFGNFIDRSVVIRLKAMIKKYGMGEFKERMAPRFPALSTIGVLGIVFVAMALKADTILAKRAPMRPWSSPWRTLSRCNRQPGTCR